MPPRRSFHSQKARRHHRDLGRQDSHHRLTRPPVADGHELVHNAIVHNLPEQAPCGSRPAFTPRAWCSPSRTPARSSHADRLARLVEGVGLRGRLEHVAPLPAGPARPCASRHQPPERPVADLRGELEPGRRHSARGLGGRRGCVGLSLVLSRRTAGGHRGASLTPCRKINRTREDRRRDGERGEAADSNSRSPDPIATNTADRCRRTDG
jgi:hypothetical protein